MAVDLFSIECCLSIDLDSDSRMVSDCGVCRTIELFLTVRSWMISQWKKKLSYTIFSLPLLDKK